MSGSLPAEFAATDNSMCVGVGVGGGGEVGGREWRWALLRGGGGESGMQCVCVIGCCGHGAIQRGVMGWVGGGGGIEWEGMVGWDGWV